MAKDKRKKHRGLIEDYVEDEYERSDEEIAEFREWKRQRELEREQARRTSSTNRADYNRSNQNRNRKPVKKKKKKRHPFRLIFKIVLLILLIFLAWNLVSFIGFGTGDSVKNYLLIGQDRREGEGTERSDAMILASVNTDTKTITLTSIMRDLYVEIPGHDKGRINSAYEYGGMELLDETIENAFDIQIDGNVEVDFDNFITAMTAVGNLDIELKDYEAEYLNVNSSYGLVDNYAWNLTAGMNSLTPEQALAYSRIRYVGNSDWERTQRQRTVMTTAFQKLKSSGPLTMIQVAVEVIPNLTTDMSPGELTALAASVGFGGYDIGETYRVPFDGMYQDVTLDSGAMVLSPDLEANTKRLHEIIYGDSAA